MDTTDLLNRLNYARAKMAFLTKALKATDATREDPLTEEEKAGFKLFFDAICEDLEAIPKEFQKKFRAEMERKALDLVTKN
jgi:hypothetical protein